MAVPRQEPRSWGRSEPAVPPPPVGHLPRLHGPGLGYPDWLDTSMEPPDAGEVSSVGSFFSRVAVSAAPPDTARLPGLLRGPDTGRTAPGALRRYGPQSSVEVRISRQEGEPPPAAAGRVKGVQFSPLVSEVRWRETYLDDDSSDGRSLSPAWDGRQDPGAPPRPPLPAQHAALRPAGPASSAISVTASVTASAAAPPPPPPRTDSRPAAARPAETQRLRVSYPVDSGDGGGVRRKVVTCERAADLTPPTQTTPGRQSTQPPQPRTDGADMERRRNGSLTSPPAGQRATSADKPRTMMERLGLGRLSGGRRRPAGQERDAAVSRRSPSPGVSSVVVRETEIVSPRPEMAATVSTPSFDGGALTSTPVAAARTVTPAEEALVSAAAAVGRAWDVSSRGASAETPAETSAASQPPPQRPTGRLERINPVSSAPDSEPTPAPEESVSKPPLPPRITPSQVTRARLSSARHQFLTPSSPASTPGEPQQPWGPAPRAVPPPPVPDVAPDEGTAMEVRDAFEKFRRQAREDRERLAQSTPDLSLIETTTKQLVRSPSPDPRPRPVETPVYQQDDGYEIDWGESISTVRPAKGATKGPSPSTTGWPKVPPPRRQTDSDLPCQETDLDAIVRGLQQFIDELSPPREKAKSLLNLEEAEQLSLSAADSRAKSMEFLLDDENKATTLPPENQLMRGGEAARQLSRHELRFQRSLRNLNTPEWYRRAAVTPVAAQRRHLDNASLQGGWSGLSSKTNSRESLAAGSAAAAPTPLPRRGDWRSFRAARETASVPRTASVSPVPLCRRGSAGSGRRAGPPPVGSPSAAGTPPGLRRPYLGWRSQERLTRQGYQTPVERLASSFRGTPGVRRQVGTREEATAGQEPARPPPPAEDVRTSIREVTDAIVHYFEPTVQGQNGRQDSPAVSRASREESPSKQRALWLETAFVGSRPVDGRSEPTKGGSTVDRRLAPGDARKERYELGEFVAV